MKFVNPRTRRTTSRDVQSVRGVCCHAAADLRTVEARCGTSLTAWTVCHGIRLVLRRKRETR